MNEQKNPDEIVLEDVKMFHLENMSKSHLWAGLYTEDNKTYHLNISAKGSRLIYYWSDETLSKPVQGHTRRDLDAL